MNQIQLRNFLSKYRLTGISEHSFNNPIILTGNPGDGKYSIIQDYCRINNIPFKGLDYNHFNEFSDASEKLGILFGMPFINKDGNTEIAKSTFWEDNSIVVIDITMSGIDSLLSRFLLERTESKDNITIIILRNKHEKYVEDIDMPIQNRSICIDYAPTSPLELALLELQDIGFANVEQVKSQCLKIVTICDQYSIVNNRKDKL